MWNNYKRIIYVNDMDWPIEIMGLVCLVLRQF